MGEEQPEPASALDGRTHAYRADLADIRLRGKVASAAFVDGKPRQVRAAALPLRERPDMRAGLANEALFGETMRSFEERAGWAWVQLDHDGYVGYVPAQALSGEVAAATHRVAALGTFVYPEPNIKTTPLLHLTMNAMVAIDETDGKFSRLTTGGYIVDRHLLPVDKFSLDYAILAERFAGTPYLWGGRTRLGLDCSGLVQICLTAAGIACPRDSDMQLAAVGAALALDDDLTSLERGDLVFWRGHVGIMIDGVMLVHANAHHMATVVEPLAQAEARIRRSMSDTEGILAIKRLERRGRGSGAIDIRA